jgi:4-amino-4-deoxy-L-arabinose transferase-like glycosyltransferase
MPLIVGAVAGAATYFMTKKKGKKPKLLLSLGVGVGGYFLYKQFANKQAALTQQTMIVPATLPQPVPTSTTTKPSTGQDILAILTQGANLLTQQQQTDYSQGYAGMDYSQLTQEQDYSQLV